VVAAPKPRRNPFASDEGLANSNYGVWSGDELLVAGKPAGRATSDVHAAFQAVIHDPEFPCVGAKSVANQHSYRFGLYHELPSPEATDGLSHDLFLFSQERPSIEGEFTSFIASFTGPKMRSAKAFETLLWRQLAALHGLDRDEFEWNAEVSSNPEDPQFSFSFAGGAYFVVGLSPASRRWARRFPWPTLVFNDHFQFERLRRDHQFERIRDTIRERDGKLHGEFNPMLSDYGGAHSEARQYSGRKVGETWRCPVHFD